MKLVAYYGDATTTSFDGCTTTEHALTAEDTDKWGTSVVDLSSDAGKNLIYFIGGCTSYFIPINTSFCSFSIRI